MTGRTWARSLRHGLGRPGLWGVYLFAFSCYAAFLVAFRPRGFPGAPVVLAGQLVSASLFFFAMVWLAPLPWRTKASTTTPFPALRRGLQAFLFSQAWMLSLVVLDDGFRRLGGIRPHPAYVYWLHALFMAPALFLVGALQSMKETAESQKQEMSAQVAEAQSRQLQGQLHPHVLFNALNALAEVIQEDPVKAEANVRAMSSLLRRVLNASEASTFALAEEVALVKDYLSMEAMRLESRLRIAWDWDASVDEWRTLPLLIQPLVENAVKHGIARSRTGGDLLIRSHLETGVVVLEVRNTGVALGDSDAPGTGVGLKNLRRRLGMAYGDGARLQLRYEDGWTIAEIRIQMDRLSPALSDPSGRIAHLPPEPAGVLR